MKNKRLRLLLLVVGIPAVLVLLLVLALVLFVDVNSYRPMIEAKAEEALGRDVRLGEMSLSFFPLGVKASDVAVAALPEEGGGDLISVGSLRVGARLFALIGGRLEVTQVVLVSPSIVLERAADGSWNVERLLRSDAAEAGAPAEEEEAAPAVSVDRLRISGGAITLRARATSSTIEITGLDLDVRDLALDREVSLTLSADVAGAQVSMEGRAGPLSPPAGSPKEIHGTLRVAGLVPATLATLSRAAGGPELPDGLLGEPPLTATLGVEATFPADGSAASIAVGPLDLRGVDLTLRKNKRGWNFDPLLSGGSQGSSPSSAAPGPRIELADLSLSDARIRVIDETADLDVGLEDLDVSLDRSPTSAPATLSIEAALQVAGKRTAGLLIQGSLGPLADDEAVPVDLLVELQEARVEALGRYLKEQLDVGLTSGTLDLAVKLTGSAPETVQLSGTLDLAGAEVHVPAPGGGVQQVELDVNTFFDIASSAGGKRLEFRKLDLTLAGNQLSLTGKLDRTASTPQIDARLAPTRLEADDLAGLLALAAYDVPFAFSSDRPIEIEAAVRGPLGGDRYPQVDGKLSLSGFSFRHPSMRKPVEEIAATISLEGETVRITGFSARVGESDVAGELTARGFDKPRIQFAMRSKRADFWELMSFVSGGEAPSEAPASGETPESTFLEGVVADGTLKIDRGSFQTLEFTELDAGLAMKGQVLTLDPFSMKLYDGTFRGAATLDASQDPPAFQVRSDLRGVDIEPMLAQNLDLPGMLFGRFQGNLEVRGRGADYETIIRGLSGGGSILVSEGRVGKLDVLKVLTKATGVFGEQSLQSLSSKLQSEGTPFQRLSATLKLQGAKASSTDLLLESPDLVLKGKAELDLIQAILDGDVQVIFSPQLSQSMRAEGSRAAQAFWDPGRNQVLLPVTLSGPVTAPMPNVDWGDATRNVARNQLEKEARKRLGDLGGLVGGGAAGEGARSSLAPSEPTPGETGAGAAAAGELEGEISRVRWGGSFLVKDLKIDGLVRGRGIDHATLVVADAAGGVIDHWDRLDEVETYFASGVDRNAPAAISWDATVDGKKLGGRGPYTIVLTVHHVDGRSVEVRTTASK